MGFKDLNNTQLVAFILGVVFSLLAVAAVFWAFKYAGKINSKAKIALYTMILPFIAITSWLILIFSFIDGFKQDEILNIFVSIAISLVICFMILTIAYVLYQKHKDRFVEDEETNEEISENENIEETVVTTEEQNINTDETAIEKEEIVEELVEEAPAEQTVEATEETTENVEAEVEEIEEQVDDYQDEKLEEYNADDEDDANNELIIEEPIEDIEDNDAQENSTDEIDNQQDTTDDADDTDAE